MDAIGERERKLKEIAELALSRLEVAKRATFVMFEIESLSCLEIAELMNVPVGTVYSRLHSARKQLEKRGRLVREVDPGLVGKPFQAGPDDVAQHFG